MTGVVLRRHVTSISQVVESQTENAGGQVSIDLRGLKAIRPSAQAALAIHAVALAHAGHQVLVTLPTDSTCCEYLEKVSGLCWFLSNFDVCFAGRQRSGPFSFEIKDTILRLTTVGIADVVKVTEQVYEGFERTGTIRSSVLLDEIFEGLWEPADNALEHARSDVGVVCLAQTWRTDSGRFAEIAVADAGIGILRTLQRRYPGLSSHQDAVERALEEGVSGVDDNQRGLGLTKMHHVSMSGAHRRLTIVSGNGCVVATPDGTRARTLTKSWSGTLVSLLFPLSQ